MSKARNLSLEILTESDELRKIDSKGQVLIPHKQREEAGMEPGDNYVSITISIKSEDPKYNGARGILVFPVNLTYVPKGHIRP